jgi:transcriptional regulator with XRE-family HTH domain
MELKGWTLEELAEKLGMSKNSTQKRIERAKIEPSFTGSLYPPDTYERIREALWAAPENPRTAKPGNSPWKSLKFS